MAEKELQAMAYKMPKLNLWINALYKPTSMTNLKYFWSGMMIFFYSAILERMNGELPGNTRTP